VDDSVGVLARPCDGESMAEAIASLYERDLEVVGAAARARVLKHFTWMQALSAQVTTYTSLVGGRRIHVPARPAIGLGSPAP
jgi:glycosyltransferase involved in cell wall biosynthesis